jgi:hypothetical protein
VSTADEVYLYLLAQNLAGGATGWALLRRRMTDQTTDQLVVIGEDGGPPPEFPAASGLGSAALADRGVLVTVRAKEWDSDASFAKADAILRALNGLVSVELVSGGALYFRIRALTPEPIFAGFDAQSRPAHTVALRLLTDATNL